MIDLFSGGKTDTFPLGKSRKIDCFKEIAGGVGGYYRFRDGLPPFSSGTAPVQPDIGDDQILPERSTPYDSLAGRIDHDAAAVEDKFVLSAEKVQIAKPRIIFARSPAHQFFPVRALSAVIR